MSGDRGILPLTATDPGGQNAYARIYNTPWGAPRSPEPPASSYFQGGITLDPPRPAPTQPAPTGQPLPQAGVGAADLMVPSLHGADWSDESLQLRTGVSEMLRDIQATNPALLGQVWIEGPMGGYRTHEQQEKLYAQHQAGQLGRTARPGDSLHEQGLAVDWHFASPEAKQQFYAYAQRHGFVFPFPDDDAGHMQLAGNARLASQMSQDRSGMWDIMQRVESSNGIDLSEGQTDSGPSQGINQITTDTWKEFARKAGVDTAQYPNAKSAPVTVQNQVAAVIPLGRWGGNTVKAIEAVYGPLDHSKPFGELAGGLPQGSITAGMSPAGKAAYDARNQSIAGIQESLNALIRKMNETDPSDAEMRDLLRQHREYSQQLERAYLERAFHAPERTQTDVWSQFGSLAMMAAVFGGFAARVPAVASLNAAGAALEAQAANNDRDYRDQLEVWKTQTNALQHAITMEHNQIQDIVNERNTSFNQKHTKLAEAFQVLGYQRDLANLQAGNYEAIQKDQEHRLDMAKKVEDLRKAVIENQNMQDWGGNLGKDNEENQLVRAELMRRAQELNPNASDGEIVKAAHQLARDPIEFPAAVQRAHQDKTAGEKAGAERDIAQRAALKNRQWDRDHPDASQDERDQAHSDNELAARREVSQAEAKTGENLEVSKQYEIVDDKGNVVGPPLELRERKDRPGFVHSEDGSPLVLEPGQHVRGISPSQAGGGRAAQQVLRQIVGGREVLSDLQNVSMLPVGQTTSTLYGYDPGKSLWGTLKSDLVRSLTDQDAALMQGSMAGLQRELSILQSPVYVTQGSIDQLDKLVPMKGDTLETALFKIARSRQVADNALEGLSKSPIVSNKEREYARQLRAQLRKYIPYSSSDIVQWTRSGQSTTESFGQFLEHEGIAPPPEPPSTKAINFLRAHPETRPQFDEKYGEGSAASALEE